MSGNLVADAPRRLTTLRHMTGHDGHTARTPDSAAERLAVLERYYDAVPRPTATTEEVGPFTLFLADEGTGWQYYARPRLGLDTDVTPRTTYAACSPARPSSASRAPLEWVDEVTPSLLPAVREAVTGAARARAVPAARPAAGPGAGGRPGAAPGCSPPTTPTCRWSWAPSTPLRRPGRVRAARRRQARRADRGRAARHGRGVRRVGRRRRRRLGRAAGRHGRADGDRGRAPRPAPGPRRGRDHRAGRGLPRATGSTPSSCRRRPTTRPTCTARSASSARAGPASSASAAEPLRRG